MVKIQFGYWECRARGEPARLLLEYGGLDYEDIRYGMGEPPNFDLSSWFGVKFTLGLEFPNLPWVKDGDVALTQAWAIYKYIGEKVGLAAKTDKELYESDMLSGIIDDFWYSLSAVVYSPDYEAAKVEVKVKQTEKLQSIEKFLTGRKYLLGDRLTYVDFPFFERLNHHVFHFPDILDPFPNIQGFVKRVAASNERIAAYLKSDRLPIHGKMASKGASK